MIALIAQQFGSGPVGTPQQQPPVGYPQGYAVGPHPMMMWLGGNPGAVWFFGILWFVTWILVIAILVVLLRWLWKKADKESRGR